VAQGIERSLPGVLFGELAAGRQLLVVREDAAARLDQALDPLFAVFHHAVADGDQRHDAENQQANRGHSSPEQIARTDLHPP
jgi:hypothetical protein